MNQRELLKEILKNIMDREPDIIVDILCGFTPRGSDDNALVDYWIDCLEIMYSINQSLMSGAPGLAYQEYEDRCSDIGYLIRQAKEYQKLKEE